ncbi:hypothetical protein LPB67_06725 [Undibacterium sp. Jales W-56]|uniref:hypothetical protein n=1 Tax=Undibacterium sp. Jales W-56 TaxID=2897325 RepID=UPI0021D3BA9A|nr:hypothetical protein [Undibacterium sp. Jales W-56]MCU6433475.1 hypothetical protein [Undibacterium sp. Jales W-56]
MWKIAVAFIVFAGAALFFIFKAGDKVDMQGEAGGHDMAEVHAASAAASAPVSVEATASSMSTTSATPASATAATAASK